MRKIKHFFSLLPPLVLWLMISVIFWCWVFTLLTDTSPENKIMLYADVPYVDETALAARLEETPIAGIRMVKAHAFSHAMLDTAPLRNADLYLIPLSEAGNWQDWYVPLPDELISPDCLVLDGTAVGIPLLRADGTNPAAAMIRYDKDEPYFLFFGNNSAHIPDAEHVWSNAAVLAAATLLQTD